MAMNESYKYEVAERVAIEQLKEKYERDNYTVISDYKIGDCMVDLYAEKGDLKFAFEFKARINHINRKHLEKVRNAAKEMGIHFRVIIVQPPMEKKIEIEGFETSLEDYFRLSMPSDLDELSTHTMIEEVEEVSIDNIEIKRGGLLLVKGKSEVLVELNYGSEQDNISSYYNVPFTFQGIWIFDNKGQIKVKTLQSCIFDTSDFSK